MVALPEEESQRGRRPSIAASRRIWVQQYLQPPAS